MSEHLSVLLAKLQTLPTQHFFRPPNDAESKEARRRAVIEEELIELKHAQQSEMLQLEQRCAKDNMALKHKYDIERNILSQQHKKQIEAIQRYIHT